MDTIASYNERVVLTFYLMPSPNVQQIFQEIAFQLYNRELFFSIRKRMYLLQYYLDNKFDFSELEFTEFHSMQNTFNGTEIECFTDLKLMFLGVPQNQKE